MQPTAQARTDCRLGGGHGRRRILHAQRETTDRGGKAILSGGLASVAGKDGFYIKPALYLTEPGMDVSDSEILEVERRQSEDVVDPLPETGADAGP